EAHNGFGENAKHFTNQDELIHSLKSYLKNNVTVLIKGSRSMKMEKIVESFIPEKKLEHTH
ncbi:MAG: UDP-N-acetylmuramoyl-tripeptide--D-alanyl-D-alanine ligase, partial [Gammaproteobacteria bacterium]|nr:UDP-N-acetylmuramoyl-tripeptide--D-alanyl-D-alanine ligase [Gammaproteobacteria bacterium]